MSQKQNNLGIELVFVGIALLALLVYVVSYPLDNGVPGPITKVCTSSFCFNVEIADTEAEREVGLMNRTDLASNEAMLFVFQREADYAFWMKDTLIPLDMIWIDRSWRVTYIAHDVQPCLRDPCPIFDPMVPALYVLEAPSGSADKLGLKIGSRLNAR